MQDEIKKHGPLYWARIAIIGRRPQRTLLRAAVTALAIFLVGKFVLLPRRIVGPSMLPTYRDHGFNIVNRLAYVFHEPRRGDVVCVKLAGETVMYMKRIVALPGETFAFKDGRLTINGQALDEPYIKYPCHWNSEPRTLGPGEYYVTGDNRSMRMADHAQGIAERRRIAGKALL